MTDADMKLMHEILKKLQDGQARIIETLADHSQQFIAIRDDIHGVRGDVLRLERSIAETKVRLERIERRLELVDA
jgi:hypothetical protein